MVKIVSTSGLDLSGLNDEGEFNPDGIDFSFLIKEENKRRRDEPSYVYPQSAKLVKVTAGKKVKVVRSISK